MILFFPGVVQTVNHQQCKMKKKHEKIFPVSFPSVSISGCHYFILSLISFWRFQRNFFCHTLPISLSFDTFSEPESFFFIEAKCAVWCHQSSSFFFPQGPIGLTGDLGQQGEAGPNVSACFWFLSLFFHFQFIRKVRIFVFFCCNACLSARLNHNQSAKL